MTPSDFIRKWEKSELKESAAAQSHFVDLCQLLDVETPTDADAVGDTYCFEKGATKSTGGNGFADVWKKGCFGWEYKGPNANLNAAYAQLQRYAVALENPPLLIVSDTKTIIIRTNWTNSVSEVHTFALTNLVDAKVRETLKNCFVDPEALRPKRTRDDLTKEAADEFSALAQRLRDEGHRAETVAHFVNRLVFCMFAEDVGLLPNKMFERAIEHARKEPEKAQEFLETLFAAMNSGGPVGFETVPWFNGGLFDDDKALPLGRDEIDLVYKAAKLNWTDIDPSILGTLFERGLDPSKRSQLGAHYTDRDKIMMIINPVIIEPLESEWTEVRQKIADIIEKAPQQTKDKLLRGAALAARTKALKQAENLHRTFTKKLEDFRVLDPACGSGNFLYLSLKALKDIEHRANVEAEALGLPRGFPRVGPEAVKGIELNPYAAELARVSVWIGEIQWMLANGFAAKTNPVLDPLDNIECRDAILNEDGTRAQWPHADVVVGNPPFLGSKFFRKGKPATSKREALDGLGDNYTDKLLAAYKGRTSGTTNLVGYWFDRLRTYSDTSLVGFGLVFTKSALKGVTNKVLRDTLDELNFGIFCAYPNEEWVIDGAEVRVALGCGKPSSLIEDSKLDGINVDRVNSDFSTGIDITGAKSLDANRNTAFQGVKQNGPFEVPGSIAREMILAPTNPDGSRNSDVIKPFVVNDDITMRDTDKWIIDFTDKQAVSVAALYERPFEWLKREVSEFRGNLAEGAATETEKLNSFWLMQRPRTKLRAAIQSISRVIAVPETSEHLIFRFRSANSTFSGSVFVIARDDFTSFGILQSSLHGLWARQKGNDLGVGDQNRYNATATFLTFPFPEGLTPSTPSADYANNACAVAIANAAARLNDLRESWLNPSDLVKLEPEVVPGYPDRVLPVDSKAADVLKKRTLTNLYNERPVWLDHAHRDLDRAVSAAYGWQDDFDAGILTDQEILKRLFELNQERAKQEQAEA